MPKFKAGDRVILNNTPAYPYSIREELTVDDPDCVGFRAQYAPEIVVKLTGRKGVAHTYESRLTLAAPLSPFEEAVQSYIRKELSPP